ncbi:MAG TPA: Tim44/TimA family putative adaptor protein [Stellaceae bacterium]|nr:Tim44/TimA family putative adaptor protein [Stellaceae bacterium]
MDGGYQVIDILLFAGIAAFLVFRLRSVLGRRTGLEQRRDPFAPPPPPGSPKVLAPRLVSGNGGAAPPATGLAAIKATDPGFTEDAFIKGARGAFEIIVNAFAAADKGALQPLLSKDVYERFAEAIDARLAAKQVLQTNLLSVKAAEIVDSALENGAATITVKFASEQTNLTRAADGTVVDGDPKRVEEHVDYWTFARPVRARDPNWTLVATKSP